MVPAIQPAAHLLSAIDSKQIEELSETFVKKNRKQKIETLYGSEQKISSCVRKKHRFC